MAAIRHVAKDRADAPVLGAAHERVADVEGAFLHEQGADDAAALVLVGLDDVPDGVDEHGNVQRHVYGRIREYGFAPKPHDDLGGALARLYRPIALWSLRRPAIVIAAAAAMLLATLPFAGRLGSEFMPPLDEGTLLYMPASLPGMSITKAAELLQMQDRIIKSFPEVEWVTGHRQRCRQRTPSIPRRSSGCSGRGRSTESSE